ncbi:MAG: aminotransferase class V-fold PLP-dependent enzyme [Clostridia bacterium]|nr:aminotransferase class V-fold PLP-dependent enzyme [Clostridia bacterium]
MIYLDNAATTYPKPPCVMHAVAHAMQYAGGNPGRSGHPLSLAAAELMWDCRESAAEFLGCASPENVIFTMNCTMSINIVLKGLLARGGRVLISDMEHNAVMRPLHSLARRGFVKIDVAEVTADAEETVVNFRRKITPETRAIVCIHASNVFGVAAPIRALGQTARLYGLPFVVDGAQSAGVLPLNMAADNIDFLCLPGHKGLYGPMGTGLLLCSGRFPLAPLIEGGTGTQSLDLRQPDTLPERLESGTPNVAGICGLRAGIEWVRAQGVTAVAAHECRCIAPLYRTLKSLPNVQLYAPAPRAGIDAPILSFSVDGVPSEAIADRLHAAGVAVRAGYHCAPAAHKKFGSPDGGTVRLAPSAFTSPRAAQDAGRILYNIVTKFL